MQIKATISDLFIFVITCYLSRFLINDELSSDPRYLLAKMKELKTKMQVVLTSPHFQGQDILPAEVANALFDKVQCKHWFCAVAYAYADLHVCVVDILVCRHVDD